MNVHHAAFLLGAEQADIPGLWRIPHRLDVPELTSNQLIDLASRETIALQIDVQPTDPNIPAVRRLANGALQIVMPPVCEGTVSWSIGSVDPAEKAR